ncbi:hypothetical protein SAMN04488128_106376 [Chitinophaga eiseniae]|uniref:PH domain-containing protein n=1 Tax=Chitinophaga eiseniae TaxID=634771 RepID=A0A1T4TV37_9BACT|nr:hypothetical protein [Chitinophaga eiseniae]SKA44317.1 hypothetical protein SAMN04488128_106376 [Chitinophaga eiseniae]
MEQPKYFTREGNVYKMKPQLGFNIVVIGLALAFVVLGIYIKSPGVIWIFAACGVIFVLSAFTKSLVIDMDKKEISGRMALIKPVFTIPIAAIQHFELYSVRQNFITTNTTLNMYYLKDGKEKSVSLVQGFTARGIQGVLNDIEEIISTDESKG